MEDYQKAGDKIAKELISRVNTAMENARWLAGRVAIEDENPSTSVNAMLQYLKDVSGS